MESVVIRMGRRRHRLASANASQGSLVGPQRLVSVHLQDSIFFHDAEQQEICRARLKVKARVQVITAKANANKVTERQREHDDERIRQKFSKLRGNTIT